METGVPDSGGGDLHAIARRLESLEKKIEQAESADRGARMTARLITIAIAVVAVAGVAYLLYPLVNAYNNSDEYYKAMYTEFEERVQPAVAREVQASLETVGPVVVEIARKQLETRQPELVSAVDRQMTGFFASMRSMGEEELADRVTIVETGVKARFAKLFPELADDPEKMEVILGNADLAMEQAVGEVVMTHFSPHMDSLANIETRLRQFAIPERLKRMDDVTLSEEFNRALAEYAIIMIRDLFLQGSESLETAPVIASASTAGGN